MKQKTDFYALVHIYAGENGDRIVKALWEARKMALNEFPKNEDLIHQINGALRIRVKEMAPGAFQ